MHTNYFPCSKIYEYHVRISQFVCMVLPAVIVILMSIIIKVIIIIMIILLDQRCRHEYV